MIATGAPWRTRMHAGRRRLDLHNLLNRGYRHVRATASYSAMRWGLMLQGQRTTGVRYRIVCIYIVRAHHVQAIMHVHSCSTTCIQAGVVYKWEKNRLRVRYLPQATAQAAKGVDSTLELQTWRARAQPCRDKSAAAQRAGTGTDAARVRWLCTCMGHDDATNS